MPDDPLLLQPACLAGVVASLVVGTFAHEFGHAMAAWVVGAKPRLISIGGGPILARLRLGAAWVVVRAFPIGGFVHTLVEPETTRTQRLVTIAGGPSANVLLLGAALLYAATTHPSGAASAAATGWSLGQLFMLAVSLIPIQRKAADHVSSTDAMQAYRVVREDPRASFRTLQAVLLRRHLPDGAQPPAPSSQLAEIVFHRTRRDRALDAWAQDDVAAGMRRVLAHPDLPNGERSLAEELLGLVEAQQRVRAGRAELAALRRYPTGR